MLDHQDWLASFLPEALQEEWELILENSRPGTRTIQRSATPRINFFPQFVLDKVDFDAVPTQEQQALDRVGTYASVYVGQMR